MKDKDDHYIVEETQRRLQKTLQGAFAGPPIPLKDIPKRNGEARALQQPTKANKRRKTRD